MVVQNMSSIKDATQLNLARKWRSARFEEIIGQDLSVKILKNSLYLNSFFPVYLFSGNRGCGKTTTARVFAAAINCTVLSDFQKNPVDAVVPCHICSSCLAFASGSHPDFIEIDAASNTGVDNVRQIIESSTFLPLMGRKKIYLIDEAHMLSKAAFNAFLKVLEEPPAGVLFILATTDVQKIIDTVRSRSFQLFFGYIKRETLVDHLALICTSESIEYERDGLVIIAREAEGSARDAINLLERVRFSCASVTKASVLAALGHMSDERLIQLILLLGTSVAVDELLRFLEKTAFNTFSPEFMWRRLLELLTASLRVHSNVPTGLPESSHQELEKAILVLSRVRLVSLLEALCISEQVFLKTRTKHLFLETLFVRIVSAAQHSVGHNTVPPINTQEVSVGHNVQPVVSEVIKQQVSSVEKISADINMHEFASLQERITEVVGYNENMGEKDKKCNNLWKQFIESIDMLDNPLIKSILLQGVLKSYDAQEQVVSVSFPKKFIFFNDLLMDPKGEWHGYVCSIFGERARLVNFFEEVKVPLAQEVLVVKSPQEMPMPEKDLSMYSVKSVPHHGVSLGEKSQMIKQHFPGRITEV
jgi:DNA polymerase III subunit gamma/tau